MPCLRAQRVVIVNIRPSRAQRKEKSHFFLIRSASRKVLGGLLQHPLQKKAARLDPAVTLSVLPDAPEAKRLGRRLFQMGRELMLHLPMEAEGGEGALEPVVLNSRMARLQFQRAVLIALKKQLEAASVVSHTV